MVELASISRDENEHVAVDTRRAATLQQDVFRLVERLRAVPAMVGVGDP